MSYEIGMQGEICKNLNGTINTFYKDITNLVGTRFVSALPINYFTYFNVEYANAKGIEAIFDFKDELFSGKVSYTLSWARGTSSYADEVYYRYYSENPDTTIIPPQQEYYLDFDQRHRIFIQGVVNIPLQTKLYLFSFIGNGFPYTPPGPEGKYRERNISRLPFQRQIDCVVSKLFKVGKLSANINLEIVNLLDTRYEIAYHGTLVPLEAVHPWDFNDFMSIREPYYHPAADLNHDGLITPYEEYTAYRESVKATDDWVNAYSSPRRARIGININL